MTVMEKTQDAHKWAEQYHELGTGPIPIEDYISEEQFQREKQMIFRRSWLYAGRVEELANPGDYFVKDIEVLGSSMIFVRGKDGEIRGFHNMCSHRGAKLTYECKGNARGFACPFHRWTYDLNGDLIAVTDEECFFDFDKAEHGLTQVQVGVWEGFIFFNVAENPEETLEEYLGDWGRDLTGYPFAEKANLLAGWQAEVDANWKICLNGFLEAYHFSFIHEQTLPALKPSANPTCHPLAFRLYEKHRKMCLEGNPDFKPLPSALIAHKMGSFRLHEALPVEKQHSGVNLSRKANWVFDANAIFPNTLLAVYSRRFVTIQFWPLTRGRTYFQARLYAPKANNVGDLLSQEQGKCAFRDTLQEDFYLFENIEQVLHSGAKTHFLYQDNEILLRHFHEVVARESGATR